MKFRKLAIDNSTRRVANTYTPSSSSARRSNVRYDIAINFGQCVDREAVADLTLRRKAALPRQTRMTESGSLAKTRRRRPTEATSREGVTAHRKQQTSALRSLWPRSFGASSTRGAKRC